MAVSFTDEQKKVIDCRDRNILVSAAAGSGKTAVLVERIIRMIMDEEHPVDIDRLLVVTFTQAAAAEMRERISQALSKQLECTPESVHLQKQAALLHNAQINTIDSFCLSLIRNNFNDIGLDPGFRNADENEMGLLKKEVMTELLEQYYGEGRQEFLDCVEYFTGGSNDRLLEEYIEKLYNFSMSNPWPEEWLTSCMRDYEITKEDGFSGTGWSDYLVMYIKATISECAQKMGLAKNIAQCPSGPYMYGEMLEQEQEMLEKLAECNSLQEFYERFETISFRTLSSKKDESVNQEERDKAKSIRDGVKKQIKGIKEKYLLYSSEQIVKRMQKAAPCVQELLRMVIAYKQLLDSKKRQKNIIDFYDMEHMALHILLKKDENGSWQPTAAAREYRQYFTEVIMDEYQDSNPVQELLLKSVSGEDEGHYNRFMVGDVKQSIYKFRLARPEIFIEKYQNYSREDGNCQRIDLRKNFRSRMEVLDSVNKIFSQIMGKELGGIEYDADAALYLGANYPSPENENEYQTEYLIGGADKEASLSTHEQEARLIAQRIKDLYRELKVLDKETQKLRPVRYGDMVILLRTASGWSEEFKKVLEKEGIPVFIPSRTGYFEASEIKVLMEFLHVLDNPLQDIPFYGTMRSFFGEFSEEEIARLRAKDRKSTLFELLSVYCRENQLTRESDEYALQKKCQVLLDKINDYRRRTTYTPIHKLIQDILTDTGYLDYVTARPDGMKRRANVEMLLTRAAAFENTSYYGLFHFLQYIQQLKRYDMDYGEADVSDEYSDVVRIMSIHKSKGLEFPVCFVAGMAKKFNFMDTEGRLVADIDLGIGVDFIDSELRLRGETLKKNVIALKMRMDALGEEMRVLYVAMTRAREKLIMTAMVPDPDKLQTGGTPSFSTLANAKSYLDFLLPCLSEEEITLIPAENLELNRYLENCELIAEKQKLLQGSSASPEKGKTEELTEMLRQRFERRYPYEYLSQLFVKTTVSELKMKAMPESTEREFTHKLFEEAEVTPYIPDFIAGKEGMSGTDRGSAYHKVMEVLNLEEAYRVKTASQIDVENVTQALNTEVSRQLEQFVQEERLTQEWSQSIAVAKITDFLNSKLAERMYAADREGKLHREQPFVLGIPASRLGEQFPETEQVLVQGIIDVFFEENNRIIVADYKTDAVKTPDELVKRYRTQLDYYAEALEKLTGKTVAEKIIYSFALGMEIEM